MILLTGADGFIGRSLTRSLGNVITVDRAGCDYNGDLADTEFVNSLPDDVTVVIHLAAFNSTQNFYSTPFTVLSSIVTPTMNLLNRYPNAHWVYAGTSEEYASTVNQGWAPVPTPENVVLSIEDITNPRWCYAAGKIAMESAVISHSVEHGNTYTIVRYHNVFGADQVLHFIPEFAERVVKGDGRVWGASETRSFCYIDDAVNLTKAAMYEKNQIINIGSPFELTIMDMAERIVNIIGCNTELTEEQSKPGSTARRAPDLSKIKSIVGDYTWTDVDTGLRKTLGK
jgi:nucleoside-diphosphate-sugar epimerase